MKLPSETTVVVGMSGGVDSSVSAYLLKEQGYKVIGMFMKNWEEQDSDGQCSATKDYNDVVSVCEQLEIPYYTVNFVQEYQELVFSNFIAELKAGHTPNPDLLCNREIKFKKFLEHALKLGADYLATGHYCTIVHENGKALLGRGLDPKKDQSYFLSAIDGKALERVLFPVGGLEKSEVRAIAEKIGLSTAKKKDSTGICFIGKRDFSTFLHGYLPYQKGKLMTLAGKIVGEHPGASYFTLGQRKGLCIGGEGQAWFVVRKDIEKNIVYVEQGDDHEALYHSALLATEPSWIAQAPTSPFRCTAKIRYRQEDQACTILSCSADGVLQVEFDTPQRAITPRQAIAFYKGNLCLGSALIHSPLPAQTA